MEDHEMRPDPDGTASEPPRLVWAEVTRETGYWRGGVHHAPGERIRLPENVLEDAGDFVQPVSDPSD